MSYDTLRRVALEWGAIQQTRLRINNMMKAFKRLERPVYPWLDEITTQLERVEGVAFRDVRRNALSSSEPWIVRVAQFIEETHGLGPAVLCLVGLLPPLLNFANPAKVWKYVGLHVKSDGTAPRKADAFDAEKMNPRTGKLGAPVFSPQLRSLATVRIVDPIIKQVESPYRIAYDARKAHTAVTHPEWATDNPKAPKMHYQRDAIRYVAKRVLRDVWRAAHGHNVGDTHAPAAVPVRPEDAA